MGAEALNAGPDLQHHPPGDSWRGRSLSLPRPLESAALGLPLPPQAGMEQPPGDSDGAEPIC